MENTYNYINILNQRINNLDQTITEGNLYDVHVNGNLTVEGNVKSRLYQELNSNVNWNSVNGYYGLAKDAYPSPSLEYAIKVLGNTTTTPWTIFSNTTSRGFASTYSSKYGIVITTSPQSGNPSTLPIFKSVDGINWTANIVPNHNFSSVVFSKKLDMFNAVGSTNAYRSIYSIDGGNTWTLSQTGVDVANCNNVSGNIISCNSTSGLYNGMRISLVSSNTTIYGTISIPSTTMISNIIDSGNIETSSLIGNLDNSVLNFDSNWTTHVYSEELGIFVAVANKGAVEHCVMTSVDGINWTVRQTVGHTEWQTVCWSAELGIFVIVGINKVGISNDGINWTLYDETINSPTSIAWSPDLGLFACCSYDNVSNKIYTSKNGVVWDEQILSNNDGESSVIWIPELKVFYVAVDTNDNNYISSDGINWYPLGGTNRNMFRNCLCWAPDLGILVIANGNGGVFTSALNTRQPTSVNVFNHPYNRIDANGNWTIQSILKQGTYTSGCTTPSAAGMQFMKINNTSPVKTITNFTGGVDGQVLTLVFNDNFSNITNGGNFRLSSNLSSTRNDTLTLLFNGTRWIELSRSTNDDL